MGQGVGLGDPRPQRQSFGQDGGALRTSTGRKESGRGGRRRSDQRRGGPEAPSAEPLPRDR